MLQEQHNSSNGNELNERTDEKQISEELVAQALEQDAQNQEDLISNWQPGQWLNDRYQIEQELGRGGFGITFLAKDTSGNLFVIKTLNEYVQRQPEFKNLRGTFINEAVRLHSCHHPHIVRYIEVLLVGNLPCIVME